MHLEEEIHKPHAKELALSSEMEETNFLKSLVMLRKLIRLKLDYSMQIQ
jgi:hypothetical protein